MKSYIASLLLFALMIPQAFAGYETGTADQVLVVPHAGGRARYGQVDLAQTAAVKNQLPVAKGGTGVATLTTNGLVYGNGTSAVGSTSAGSQYQSYQAGASGVPTVDAVHLDQAAATTGLLPIASGGTASSTAAGARSALAAQAAANFLINSNFSLWQSMGTSATVGNTVTAYGPDQWYVKNGLGTTGVITMTQVAGVSTGAAQGLKVQITTAPTAAQANVTRTCQGIDQPTTLANLYGQTASFGINAKAFGNVTSVALQFYYATSEGKLTTAIGSPVTCTVNSSTFVSCAISGQALGTSMTTSGIVGVCVDINGVSSGNTYDLNNGYVLENGIVNVGSTVAAYHPAAFSFAGEVLLAQRFYEKSYDLTTVPGSVTNIGEVIITPTGSRSNTANWGGDTRFKVAKRNASSIIQLFCPDGASGGTGNNGCVLANSTTDTTAGSIYVNQNSFITTNQSGGAAGSLNGTIEFQWVADDRM